MYFQESWRTDLLLYAAAEAELSEYSFVPPKVSTGTVDTAAAAAAGYAVLPVARDSYTATCALDPPTRSSRASSWLLGACVRSWAWCGWAESRTGRGWIVYDNHMSEAQMA